MDSQEQLYLVYDNILLSLYDNLEEMKKQKSDFDDLDVDYVRDKQKLYSMIKKVVE